MELILSYSSSGYQHVCFIFVTHSSQVHISHSAVRYCGITFGYTSIAILLNYSELYLILYLSHIRFLIDKLLIVTPPSTVGYANGIAQSMASLARCIGPVVGGYVSRSGFFSLSFCFDLLKQTVFARCGLSASEIIHRDITLVSLFVL